MEMVHFIPPTQRRLAMLAAQADTAPALIWGASGTGKGAIARWIHANGPRAARPFVHSDRNSPIANQLGSAQGGTFVIDEIGELPLGEQRVLLSFLKSKSVTPADTGMPTLLNVRVIVTTSQALEGRAQGGLFNEELLEKLNVFRIEMPPLAKRTEEFDDIVMGIVGEITRELHKEHLRGIEENAWERLRGYEWPGNLRELRNVLRLAVVAAKGDRIALDDLPGFGHDRIDFRATREQFEKIYILELLKTFDWQIDETCRMTRMDKGTLLTKMSQYGIPSDGHPSH
jgi:DNA-binding NtrC family response regulator